MGHKYHIIADGKLHILTTKQVMGKGRECGRCWWKQIKNKCLSCQCYHYGCDIVGVPYDYDEWEEFNRWDGH